MNVLILGANGFIGSFLCEKILAETDWTVTALDPGDSNLGACLGNPRFSFRKDTMGNSWDWIDREVEAADAVVPLAGIARPAVYIENPLLIFELDFEENLRVVRRCAETRTRVVFPSTSEVYGMSPDEELDEDHSILVQGPIGKSRWIYSCSKQMMDRVIAALGAQKGLPYTLFRPFNWIGPRQDDPLRPEGNDNRLVPQLLGNLLRRRPLVLVDGGAQRRSFTDIDDGIEGLLAILRQPEAANGQIFNLGNPRNNHSIREVAELLREVLAAQPGQEDAASVPLTEVPATEYYGTGYQDVRDRRPSVRKAKELLGWEATRPLRQTLERTVRFYLNQG